MEYVMITNVNVTKIDLDYLASLLCLVNLLRLTLDKSGFSHMKTNIVGSRTYTQKMRIKILESNLKRDQCMSVKRKSIFKI